MQDIPDNIDTQPVNLLAKVSLVVHKTGLLPERIEPLVALFQPLANDAMDAFAAAASVKEGDIEAAKAVGKRLQKVRCAVVNKHKAEKADSLNLGRSLDFIKNVITEEIEPYEASMDAIVRAEEIAAEQAKLARSNARRAELAAIGGVIPDSLLLMEMTDQAWAAYVAGEKALKAQREAEAAKIAAEAAAREEARKAEEARLRAENDRLLAEANAAAANRRAETEKAVRKAGLDRELLTVRMALMQFGVENREKGILYGAEMVEQIDRLKKQHQTVSAEELPDIAAQKASVEDADRRLKLSERALADCLAAEFMNQSMTTTIAGLKLCAKCRNALIKEFTDDLAQTRSWKAMAEASLSSCKIEFGAAVADLDSAVKAQAQQSGALAEIEQSIEKHRLGLASLKDLLSKQKTLTAELAALDKE